MHVSIGTNMYVEGTNSADTMNTYTHRRTYVYAALSIDASAHRNNGEPRFPSVRRTV